MVTGGQIVAFLPSPSWLVYFLKVGVQQPWEAGAGVAAHCHHLFLDFLLGPWEDLGSQLGSLSGSKSWLQFAIQEL